MMYVDKKRGLFCRSLNEEHVAGSCNPWALLCSAIIAQAAVDCSNWDPDDPEAFHVPKSQNRRYLTRSALESFIDSDWLDWLLCWQSAITTLSVREELRSRMGQKGQKRVCKVNFDMMGRIGG
ncbi:MAG: hypothetical protein IIZ78_19520 [Clostridiales bacterium]|nr:hypothetical protein [Clostridiales bacterium]